MTSMNGNRVSIHGAEYPVKKIFSDDFFFTVPLYQRPYAWTTEHAGELLDDLLEFTNDGTGTSDQLTPYFLGSIVLIKGDEPDAQIVDGQQRLTTLALLLAMLRAMIQPELARNLTPFLYQKANPITHAESRYRLKLRELDDGFFQEYVLKEQGIEKLLNEVNEAGLSESQRNIRDNALLFKEKLKNRSGKELIDLAEFIVNRCYLVVVSTPDLNSAYRIFSVLNDRGLDLSISDILKARIINDIADSNEKKRYAALWENRENELGRETFKDLFSWLRMMYRRGRPRGTILEEFYTHVYPAGRPNYAPQEFLDNVLVPHVDALGTILQADYQCPQHPHEMKESNKLLKWLNYIKLDNESWIPSALLYFTQRRQQPDMLLRFLTDLERLAAGLMIQRVPSSKRLERYSQLLSAIQRGEDLYRPDSPLQLTSEEQRNIFNILNGDIYLIPQVRKYVLLRLDDRLSDGTASYDYERITIEHVLPQNPAYRSQWMQWFPTWQERVNWVNRLGNLVLLSRRINREAQNYEFAVKKERYFKNEHGVSAFALTSQVLSYQEWTPRELEQRQKYLMNSLSLLWGLKSTT